MKIAFMAVMDFPLDCRKDFSRPYLAMGPKKFLEAWLSGSLTNIVTGGQPEVVVLWIKENESVLRME